MINWNKKSSWLQIGPKYKNSCHVRNPNTRQTWYEGCYIYCINKGPADVHIYNGLSGAFFQSSCCPLKAFFICLRGTLLMFSVRMFDRTVASSIQSLSHYVFFVNCWCLSQKFGCILWKSSPEYDKKYTIKVSDVDNCRKCATLKRLSHISFGPRSVNRSTLHLPHISSIKVLFRCDTLINYKYII